MLFRCACLVGLAVGCGGSAAAVRAGTAATGACRARLPPRTVALVPPLPGADAPASAAPSRIVGDVAIPLAPLLAELEKSVGPRLAEERDRGIGFAGSVNVDVDRGPFSLTVEGDALVVRTDVRARVDVCKSGGCYASCDPRGRAEARIPLRLTPTYRFASSRVSFTFTRGCDVRVLGGLVKVDVTPTLQAALAPTLRQVERQIDSRLPPVHPHAERFFREAARTRTLPLGRCVVPHVEGIVEGPINGSAEQLNVRVGVLARPEIVSPARARARSRASWSRHWGRIPPSPPRVTS